MTTAPAPEPEPTVPTTPEGWEDFYYLPRGVLEAIRFSPSNARIAEVIAQVRDDALHAAGAPRPGYVTEGR